MKKRMVWLVLAGAIVQGTLGFAAVPASARPGDVTNGGACNAVSDWKMRGRIAHNHVKVRYEVDSAIPGLTWLVRVSANGITLFNGTRVADSNGVFEVRVRKNDAVGTDAFGATATNTFDGETCGGNLTI